jgi:iron complex outermembrane receptor protein
MSVWFRRYLATVVIVLSGIITAPAAFAETTYSFNLPEQALADSLRAIGQQTEMNILFEPEAVKNARSPALRGQYTVDEAIRLLLTGTKLEAQRTAASNLVIKVKSARTSVLPAASIEAQATSGTRLAQSNSGSPQSQTAGPQNADTSKSTSEPSKKEDLSEIIVTGTNISGVDNKTVPLMSFDRAAIDRSGVSNLGDFINTLPQNFKGSNTQDGFLSGTGIGTNNVENSTAANLRGLGSSSTLTLLNGHRVAASAWGTGVDLSMIPLEAVERVDVLTDGSSAVYGSDAIGGVINIILRKDFNGQSTTARLDTLARGGGELKQFGQTVGRTWDTGGALAVFQFDDANAIRTDQRSFTANVPQPTDIYPTSKRYSGVLSAHQSINSSVEVFGDAVLGHDSGQRHDTTGFVPPDIQVITNHTDSTSADLGARWEPFADWHLEGNGTYSQVDTPIGENFSPVFPGYTNGAPFGRTLSTIKEGDLKLDGTLWSGGGASVKAAFGGSYRQEVSSSLAIYSGIDNATSRHVYAGFAEFYAPLITATNALPGIQKLDLSAAIRDDHYSDFGSRLNPRVGLFYSPVQQVGLRASFSSSFRAPNPFETVAASSPGFVIVEPGFAQPGDPAGNTPVLLFENQAIKPETSKNLTVGLDFTPASWPTTRFSLNYYRITYTDRLIHAPVTAGIFDSPQVYGPLITQFPNDAAVAAFVAGLQPPQPVLDVTPGQTGLAGIRYAFPYGEINATKELTQGVDFASHSLVDLDATNKLIFDFNATYIKEISNTFCDSCTNIDVADTYANPQKLRLRAAAGWTNATFSVNSAVNFGNAYSDTNLLVPGRISSFTTADLNASWHYAGTGTTLTINIINLFNENPPLTAPTLNAVQYDPTNADARGRVLSLQVRQSW